MRNEESVIAGFDEMVRIAPKSVMQAASPVRQCNPDRSDRINKHIGRLVCLVVGTIMAIPQSEFHAKSRGKADICQSRQIAMYLMHTVFSCTYQEVAGFFDRDRTTVSHACNLVEDLRDDPDFDKKLDSLETVLLAARALKNETSNEFTAQNRHPDLTRVKQTSREQK